MPSGARVAGDLFAVRVGQREGVDGALGHRDRDRVEDGHIGGAERGRRRNGRDRRPLARGGRARRAARARGELADAEDESSGAGVASTVDVTVVSANEPEPQPTSTTSTPRSARTATSRTRIRANIIDQPPSSPLADGWDRKLCSQHRPIPIRPIRRVAREIVRSDRPTQGPRFRVQERPSRDSAVRASSAEQPPDDQEREEAAHGDQRVLDLRVVQGGGEGALALVRPASSGSLGWSARRPRRPVHRARARSRPGWSPRRGPRRLPCSRVAPDGGPAVHYPSRMNSTGTDAGTQVGRPRPALHTAGRRRHGRCRCPTSPGGPSSCTSTPPR